MQDLFNKVFITGASARAAATKYGWTINPLTFRTAAMDDQHIEMADNGKGQFVWRPYTPQ